MNDQEFAAHTLGHVMDQCKPHLAKLHSIFAPANCELTLVVFCPGQPGALLLTAGVTQMTPNMIIKAMHELNEQMAGQIISAYGGTIDTKGVDK